MQRSITGFLHQSVKLPRPARVLKDFTAETDKFRMTSESSEETSIWSGGGFSDGSKASSAALRTRPSCTPTDYRLLSDKRKITSNKFYFRSCKKASVNRLLVAGSAGTAVIATKFSFMDPETAFLLPYVVLDMISLSWSAQRVYIQLNPP